MPRSSLKAFSTPLPPSQNSVGAASVAAAELAAWPNKPAVRNDGRLFSRLTPFSSFRDAPLGRPGIHTPDRGHGFRVRGFASPRNDGRHKKLCGSTSTSSLRLPLVLGPAASHPRKYSDRSTPRADFTSRRKR